MLRTVFFALALASAAALSAAAPRDTITFDMAQATSCNETDYFVIKGKKSRRKPRCGNRVCVSPAPGAEPVCVRPAALKRHCLAIPGRAWKYPVRLIPSWNEKYRMYRGFGCEAQEPLACDADSCAMAAGAKGKLAKMTECYSAADATATAPDSPIALWFKRSPKRGRGLACCKPQVAPGGHDLNAMGGDTFEVLQQPDSDGKPGLGNRGFNAAKDKRKKAICRPVVPGKDKPPQPTGDHTKPTGRPTDDRTKPTSDRTKPTGERTKPTGERTKPTGEPPRAGNKPGGGK